MFETQQLAVTALITALITGILTGAVILLGRIASSGGIGVRLSAILGDLFGVALATGTGVVLWRLGANTPTLNNDSIPSVSPADVLSAPLAYVAADVYLRLRGAGASEQLGVGPAVAALVALIVNVITI
jgi:hypothetical protein